MKLNADIIFDSLKEHKPVEMIGYKSDELTLRRPEFYIGDSKPFLANHVYILFGENIPRRVEIEKGTVIICIGDALKMSFYSENCCFLKLKANENPMEVSNLINDIFNKYDTWSNDLNNTLENGADISDMLNLASYVVDNPIFLLNHDFKIISYAGYESIHDIGASYDDLDDSSYSENLSFKALNMFLKKSELQMDIKAPIFLNIFNSSTLSMNIFDTDEYAGCITIEYRNSPHKNSHNAIIKFFADFILMAMKKNLHLISSDKSILRKVFTNAVKGIPLEKSNKDLLESMNLEKSFMCVIFQLSNRYAQIPTMYVCNKLESLFPHSVAFEHQSNIVAYIETVHIASEMNFTQFVSEGIDLFGNTMDIKAGISNGFTNPYDARMYYDQAQSALENGMLIDPGNKYYDFKKYSLVELIINAQNNFPIEMYFPDGLIKLFEHDERSSASYVDTLRVYLNNNMSISATSSVLNIHRSTLMERLSHIKELFDKDLNDNNVRLELLIILKALEIKDYIAENQKPV